jgi:hypothetical protein
LTFVNPSKSIDCGIPGHGNYLHSASFHHSGWQIHNIEKAEFRHGTLNTHANVVREFRSNSKPIVGVKRGVKRFAYPWSEHSEAGGRRVQQTCSFFNNVKFTFDRCDAV